MATFVITLTDRNNRIKYMRAGDLQAAAGMSTTELSESRQYKTAQGAERFAKRFAAAPYYACKVEEIIPVESSLGVRFWKLKSEFMANVRETA